jgi:hypothetical protein
VERLLLSTYNGENYWKEFDKTFTPPAEVRTIPIRTAFSGIRFYIQDGGEIGYTALTTGAGTLKHAMNVNCSLNQRTTSRLTENLKVADPKVGFYDLGIGDDRAEMGGNIECLPPFGTHRHGMVLVGANLYDSTRFIDFLRDQKVQSTNGTAIAAIDVEAVHLGHIDEFISVVKDGDSFAVLVADFDKGMDILLQNRTRPTEHMDDIPTIASLVAMYEPVSPDEREEIADLRAASLEEIKRATTWFKGTNIRVIRIPVLVSVAATSKGGLPNSVNQLVMQSGNYMPDPFFAPFKSHITTSNIPGGSQWVDTRGHWMNGGQIHCGSNPLRKR